MDYYSFNSKETAQAELGEEMRLGRKLSKSERKSLYTSLFKGGEK